MARGSGTSDCRMFGHFKPKTTIKNHNRYRSNTSAKEQAALKIIGDSVGAFPSTFEKAYQDHPDTDFRNDDGPVKKLLAKRATAFKQLEAANTALVNANNTLTKLNNQPTDDTPKLKSTKC